MTKSLELASNSATALFTEKRINRGAGQGMELPCEFKFQGVKFSCHWLEEKLKRKTVTLIFCLCKDSLLSQ